jgi:hypothetical protein
MMPSPVLMTRTIKLDDAIISIVLPPGNPGVASEV